MFVDKIDTMLQKIVKFFKDILLLTTRSVFTGVGYSIIVIVFVYLTDYVFNWIKILLEIIK